MISINTIRVSGVLNLTIAFLIGIGFGLHWNRQDFRRAGNLPAVYGYNGTQVFLPLPSLWPDRNCSVFGLLNLKLVFINPYYINATIIGG